MRTRHGACTPEVSSGVPKNHKARRLVVYQVFKWYGSVDTCGRPNHHNTELLDDYCALCFTRNCTFCDSLRCIYTRNTLCQRSHRIFRVLLVELCAWACMLTSYVSPNLIFAHSLLSGFEVKSECSCISSVPLCLDDVHRKQQCVYLYLYHYLRSLFGVYKINVLYGFSRVRKVAESDHWLRHVFRPSVWNNCASTERIVCEISCCWLC